MAEPPRRGLFFPAGIPRVNPAHRLAAGLCFVSLAQQGICGSDIVNGRRAGSIKSTATTPFQPAVVGQAMFFGNGVGPNDGVSWPYMPIVTSNGIGTGDFTMLIVANPSSSGQQNYLFCQRDNTTAIQADLVANVNASGSQSTGAFSLFTFNGTFVGASAASAVDGAWHTFMGMRAGTTISVWKDGVQLATGSGTVQQISDATLPAIGYGVLIGDTSNSRGANCGIAFCAGWNRSLAADEGRELGLDPGCFLIWPDDDFWATLVGQAVAGGGNNYMPFFAPRPF